ncbi:MAG TPA: hypothetical protein VHA75_07025, partial [Rugosimonospora sp.]|nr:hypothetical protein [Rugosimonospora sp.]
MRPTRSPRITRLLVAAAAAIVAGILYAPGAAHAASHGYSSAELAYATSVLDGSARVTGRSWAVDQATG